MRPDEIPNHPDGWLIFPSLELGKNQWLIEFWWSSGLAAETSGREQAGTGNFSIEWNVWTEEARHPDGWCWCVWRLDGKILCSDEWSSRQMSVRTGWHIVWMADRELEFLLILTSLWKWNPCLQHLLHISDFVQTQNTAKILTNSPFGHSGTKITWPVWKYILGPNQQLLPLFVTKGQRVK